MAVAIDSNPDTVLVETSGVSSMNYTSLTIGASGNAALFVVGFGFGTGIPSGLTVTWDSVTCTQITTAASQSFAFALYGILAPTTGNQTLAVSWTGAQTAYVYGISYTGVLQTSIAAAFINVATHGTGSTDTGATITVTTTGTGDMTFGCAQVGTDTGSPPFASSPAGTTVASNDQTSTLGLYILGLTSVASGSSTTYTTKNGASDIDAIIGVDIVPAPPSIFIPWGFP